MSSHGATTSSVCERRDRDFWLLRGSEIRSAVVESGRKQDAARRDRLIEAGAAVAVRGYPDRLELLIDLQSAGRWIGRPNSSSAAPPAPAGSGGRSSRREAAAETPRLRP